MSGAGLKKCKPMTRSGRTHPRAKAVTDKDEVFVAKTASSDTMPSSD